MQVVSDFPYYTLGSLGGLWWMAFAVYNLYVFYKMIKDVNVACEGDGEKTAGLEFLILLEYVTLGVYSFIWWYKFGNRLAKNAPRYGMDFKKLGRTLLVVKISKLLFILFFCAAFIFYLIFPSESYALMANFYPSLTDMQWILSMLVAMAVGFVGVVVSHFVLIGIAFKYTNRICAGYNAAHNL
ncbi:MAG: DUF4234 domain-containing protein [Treponemataceae bacterium]|nr:DUF4234 domain-containing protein [Treponemataceae bacterium]